jgi:hypothetical protein
MSNVPLAQDGVSVVVGGAFNPAVFSADWLLHQDLIDSPTFSAMDNSITTPEFTALRFGDVALQVTREAFQVATSEASEFEPLRDLAVNILRLLSHTPVGVLGINRHFHIKADHVDSWHAIGDAIVPKAPWNDVLQLPGMRSVSLWGARPDKHAGRVQIQIEPSVAIQYGIFVSQNDHFDLYDLDSPLSDRAQLPGSIEILSANPTADKGSVAIKMLNDEWNDSMTRAERTVAAVWQLRNKGAM